MARQTRSKNTYQKINTIFKRDANNIIMPYDSFVSEDFEWLRNCKFDCEEKIDGTCIRIEVTANVKTDNVIIDNEEILVPVQVDWNVEYRGKTDNANIPKHLLAYLQNTYPSDKVIKALDLKPTMYIRDFTEVGGIKIWNNAAHQDAIDRKWVVIDSDGNLSNEPDVTKIPAMYTLYGEGYGAKIQSNGKNYLNDSVSFIGFDIKVDDLYLLKPNRDAIFNKLGCPIVPFVGKFTIDEAIEFVKHGFKSAIAENQTTFLAEGLVCRAPGGIKNRQGERIIFKVKTCDWNKYFARYGTYDKIPIGN